MEPTKSAPVTTTAVGLRYGLLVGLASTIYSFVLNMTHLEQSAVKWLSLGILGAGIVLAQQLYKRSNSGFIGFGDGLGIGMIISAVSGVISAVFSYIYLSFIDPEMIGRIMEKARTDMENRGNLSDEQIEQGMQMTTKFMTAPVMSLMVLVGSLLLGLLLSLVISAIIKNPKPEFE